MFKEISIRTLADQKLKPNTSKMNITENTDYNSSFEIAQQILRKESIKFLELKNCHIISYIQDEKKQESIAHLKKKLTENLPEEVQTLDLLDKDFRSIVLNMFITLKNTTDKNLK